MLRVALKSVLARKRRLLTTGLAIVLSVAFISGTLVITALIDSTLASLIGSSFQGIDAVVRSANAQESDFGQPYRDPIPADTLDLVREVNGVRAAEGFIQGYPTMLDKAGDRVQDTFGPPTLALNWVEDVDLKGSELAPGGRGPNGENEVVLDVRTADEFGFEVGDELTAQFPAGLRTFTIVGLAGIAVEGNDKDLVTGARVLLLDQKTAQSLLNKADGFDYIAASATEGTSQSELRSTLQLVVPKDHEVLTGEKFIEESEAAISKIISLFTQPILAFGFISVFVGIFVIYNTFSIVVAQRTRELALLRAVGAGRGQILGAVLLEAVLVGLIASGLGVVFGWALAYGLKFALGGAITLPDGVPALTVPAVLVALAVGVGSTVLSALIPGIRATTIPPVAALGAVAIDRSNMSLSRRISGTVLLVGGIALMGLVLNETLDLGLAGIGIGAAMIFLSVATLGPVFAGPLARTLGTPIQHLRGIAGRIGKENAGRNPKRTAVTAAALSIGVGLVTVVAIFAASIRGATESQLGNQLAEIDLVVDTGTGFGGLSPEATDMLRNRPEIAAVNPIRFSIVSILNSKEAVEKQAKDGTTKNGVPVGQSDFMIGVDPKAAFAMVRFDGLTPPVTDIADNEVMVLAKTAADNGWEAGDTVKVWFSTTGEQSWTIASTFTTRVGNGAEFITNLNTLNANTTAEFKVDSTIWLKLREGVSPATAMAAIKPELKKIAPTAGLNTVGDYLGERLSIVDSVVNLIYVLLGLSIVVALVGVGNTISLSIYERTRELGLLRAVGMVRAQLGESVGWESVIIAFAGTVLGLVIGVCLAIIFVNALDEQGIEPIVQLSTIVVIGALGAAAGVLTAIRPAIRATRVNVLAAISSV